MWARTLVAGFLLWVGGTVGIRLEGQRVLQPHHAPHIILLYLASFLLMAALVPRLCRRLGVGKDARFQAATLLMLPTLMLDPLSCVFFTAVFPNLDPAVAGLFGGWMLICCGGAVAGVWRAP